MTHIFDGTNWILKFNKGELLVKKLLEFATTEGIQGAWISGLGGVLWAEIGYYDLEKKEYFFQKVHDIPEATALTGNIAWSDGAPALHMHGTFSRADLSAVGGHVKELCVGGTVELFVQPLQNNMKLTRSKDQETGLNTLDV
jgi:predicted DNA-binding protein with PD1-like motif